MPVPTTSLPDFVVSGSGTVYLVRPTTKDAANHLQENVQPDAQWFGGALAVEHRFLDDVMAGLQSNGYTVGRGW